MLKHVLSVNVAFAAVFNASRLFFDFLVYGAVSTTTYASYAGIMLLVGSLSILTLGATNGLSYVLPMLDQLVDTGVNRLTVAALVLNVAGATAVGACIYVGHSNLIVTSMSAAMVWSLVFGYFTMNFAIALLRNRSDRQVNQALLLLSIAFAVSYLGIAHAILPGKAGLLFLGFAQTLIAFLFIAIRMRTEQPSEICLLWSDLKIIAGYGLTLAIAGQIFFLLSSVDRVLARLFLDTMVFARVSYLASLSSIILGISSIIISVNQPKLMRDFRALDSDASAKLAVRFVTFIGLLALVIAAILVLALLYVAPAVKYKINTGESVRVLCGVMLSVILYQSSYLQFIGLWRESLLLLLGDCCVTALACGVYLRLGNSTVVGLSTTYLLALSVVCFAGYVVIRFIPPHLRRV